MMGSQIYPSLGKKHSVATAFCDSVTKRKRCQPYACVRKARTFQAPHAG
jgi:hypothetical protein